MTIEKIKQDQENLRVEAIGLMCDLLGLEQPIAPEKHQKVERLLDIQPSTLEVLV